MTDDDPFHPAFRGSRAVSGGDLTAAQLRGPRFVRLFRDVYLPAGCDLDLLTRSRAAALLVAGEGVLAGHSAARLWRAGISPEDADAEVAVPPRYRRTQPGLIVYRGRVADDEVAVRDGLPVTSLLRTAYDLIRRPPLVEAVVAADALARRGGFRPEQVLDLASRYPGARGHQRLRPALALADPLAESPGETRCRLALVLHGLPTPRVQYRIRDRDGVVVARADLAYPRYRIAIEYDGSSHLTRAVRERDHHRDALLNVLGWCVVRCDGDLVRRHPQQLAAAVRALMADRHRAPNATILRPSA